MHDLTASTTRLCCVAWGSLCHLLHLRHTQCDGQTGQVINPTFKWTGAGPIPPFTGKGFVPTNTNHSVPGGRKDGSTSRLSICATPKHEATVCDPVRESLEMYNCDLLSLSLK